MKLTNLLYATLVCTCLYGDQKPEEFLRNNFVSTGELTWPMKIRRYVNQYRDSVSDFVIPKTPAQRWTRAAQREVDERYRMCKKALSVLPLAEERARRNAKKKAKSYTRTDMALLEVETLKGTAATRRAYSLIAQRISPLQALKLQIRESKDPYGYFSLLYGSAIVIPQNFVTGALFHELSHIRNKDTERMFTLYELYEKKIARNPEWEGKESFLQLLLEFSRAQERRCDIEGCEVLTPDEIGEASSLLYFNLRTNFITKRIFKLLDSTFELFLSPSTHDFGGNRSKYLDAIQKETMDFEVDKEAFDVYDQEHAHLELLAEFQA